MLSKKGREKKVNKKEFIKNKKYKIFFKNNFPKNFKTFQLKKYELWCKRVYLISTFYYVICVTPFTLFDALFCGYFGGICANLLSKTTNFLGQNVEFLLSKC